MKTASFRKSYTLAVALGLVLAASSAAQAQNRNTGGGTGGGQQQGGSTSGGSQGLFGNRSLGSGVNATQGNFTGRNAATTRDPGELTLTNESGDLNTHARFSRNNTQSRGFIGQNGTSDILSQMQTAAGQMDPRAGDQGRRGLQERTDVNQANQGNQAANRQRVYRVSREVAFDVPRPAGPAMSSTLTQRFAATPNLKMLGAVDVKVENQTAILRGAVGSDHDRALAARLALLEPGVSRVRNELTIAAPEAAKPR